MALGRWKILIAAAGVVVAGGAGLAVSHYRPLAVELRQPETEVAIKVFGLGTVEARVVSKIGFKVAGTLTDLRVDHGDRVAAGQVLAQIDASEQKARLAKARAQVLSAEAAVKVAEAASRKSMALVTQRARSTSAASRCSPARRSRSRRPRTRSSTKAWRGPTCWSPRARSNRPRPSSTTRRRNTTSTASC